MIEIKQTKAGSFYHCDPYTKKDKSRTFPTEEECYKDARSKWGRVGMRLERDTTDKTKILYRLI